MPNPVVNLNDYQRQALVTLGDYYETPEALRNYLSHGFLAEAGEVAGAFAKFYRGDPKFATEALLRRKLQGELGDCLWFIATLAKSIDLSLAEIAGDNIKKLQKRKKENKIRGDGDER